MHRSLSLSIVLAAATASGCTWVELAPEGRAVRVAYQHDDLSHCERAGEIAVSVRDRVGFYERDDLKVRDELETLARNEALSLRADTLQPLGPPIDGEQRFTGYRCGARAPAAAPTERAEPLQAEPLPVEPARRSQGFEPVETYPLGEDDGSR